MIQITNRDERELFSSRLLKIGSTVPFFLASEYLARHGRSVEVQGGEPQVVLVYKLLDSFRKSDGRLANGIIEGLVRKPLEDMFIPQLLFMERTEKIPKMGKASIFGRNDP
eukprot:TRINITY_DN4211_c0_g1_i3.p1 TRINITY_DN4211_c0_g1~~TRINITY_DN4211_c0_g1_i3.p1  ORF type:complete len:111 (+),score=16.52 TRINITY_DN4211_c0_g1_i3:334-666(+)